MALFSILCVLYESIFCIKRLTAKRRCHRDSVNNLSIVWLFSLRCIFYYLKNHIQPKIAYNFSPANWNLIYVVDHAMFGWKCRGWSPSWRSKNVVVSMCKCKIIDFNKLRPCWCRAQGSKCSNHIFNVWKKVCKEKK